MDKQYVNLDKQYVNYIQQLIVVLLLREIKTLKSLQTIRRENNQLKISNRRLNSLQTLNSYIC